MSDRIDFTEEDKRKTDIIELYVERKGGTNGEEGHA